MARRVRTADDVGASAADLASPALVAAGPRATSAVLTGAAIESAS
jgi:hypothetical protein